MAQLFGTFIETNDEQTHLEVRLSLSLLPIEQNWRNNSHSAKFIADYWYLFFSENNIIRSRPGEIRETISYIANELLENAMKSGYESCDDAICISLSLSGKTLRFYVTNKVAIHSSKKFQEFIHELLTGNPHDMYFRQMISNFKEEDQSASQLGFLSILCNYDTQLGWKFEPFPTDSMFILVTTMVQLAITN